MEYKKKIMKNIPTAEEMIESIYIEGTGPGEDSYDDSSIKRIMIEFAKLHVKAALQSAVDKVKTKEIYKPNCEDHTPYMGPCCSCGSYYNHDILVGEIVDKDSILNSYPLENIK